MPGRSFLFLIFTFILAFTSQGQPANQNNLLQGGENAVSAFIVTGPLPFNSTGTTTGYLDDYDETCPYPGSTAPDVVYSFSPAGNITVDIDLCGSSFDTKLYVYENTVTPGTPFDCNDDFYIDPGCGYYVSKIEGLYLSAGNTYYIVIDGYDGDAYGNYNLSITDVSPPPACTWGYDILCPPGADTENETCGANNNGGCAMAPGTETWEEVPASGGPICGTLWANAGNRDYDQFELVLTVPSLVILTADATELIQFGLISGGTGGYNGNPDCGTITGLNPVSSAGPCNENFLDLGLLNPGTYWFSTSLTTDNGYPCSVHYWLDFEVIPQPCPVPTDFFASSITSTSAVLFWIENGTATSWEYQFGPAGFSPAPTGTSTTQNPLPVAGLSPNTAYEFYVRSFCNPAHSEWEGPYLFSTLCGSSLTVPWSEGFESSWPPACWTDSETASYGWNLSTGGSAHSGNDWAYCNLAGSELKTPEFTPAANSSLTFWHRVENAGVPQSLTVKIGNDVIFHLDSATNNTYQQAGISLADYTGQPVAITFLCNFGPGAVYPGICLDDISVNLTNTWTGSISSTWNIPGNWSKGTVPDLTESVLIPSIPSGGNFPVVSGGITAECDFITLSPGATLTVTTGSNLNVKDQ